MIAIDTETALVSNADPVPRLVSIAICDGEHPPAVYHHTDPIMVSLVTAVYEHGAVLANAPFDVAVLIRRYPELYDPIVRAYEAGRVHDVLTRAKVIDIAAGEHRQHGPYSLGVVATRSGIEINKNDPWRLRFIELIDTPIAAWPTEALDYAATDASVTWRVWFDQEAYAHLFSPLADLARRHVALHAQTLQGVATDPARVQALGDRLREEIALMDAELVSAGLARWQGKKKPKLVGDTNAARLAMIQWCRDHSTPITYTASQLVALSEDALSRAGVPDIHPLGLARLRKARLAMATKVLPVLTRPRIRTRYDECIDTARTSASAPQGKRSAAEVEAWEWVGTNLQNQQKKGGFRECLRADPGHVLIVSDWAGAELVTHAQNQIDLFGRSELADVLRSGRNPHTETAIDFMGGTPYDPDNPTHVGWRQLAKIWNFGRWGGMGDTVFGRNLFRDTGQDWPLGKIAALNAVWKTRWDADHYFGWIKTLPSRTRYSKDGDPVEVRDLTHWRSGFSKGGCSYTEACNFPFQHLAAMAACDALWLVWRAQTNPQLESPLYNTRQVLFVHDEIVTQAPIAIADAALAHQEALMVGAYVRWCPDVPVGVESKIMENYGK